MKNMGIQQGNSSGSEISAETAESDTTALLAVVRYRYNSIPALTVPVRIPTINLCFYFIVSINSNLIKLIEIRLI